MRKIEFIAEFFNCIATEDFPVETAFNTFQKNKSLVVTTRKAQTHCSNIANACLIHESDSKLSCNYDEKNRLKQTEKLSFNKSSKKLRAVAEVKHRHLRNVTCGTSIGSQVLQF